MNKEKRPFLLAGLGWSVVGTAICWKWGGPGAVFWMLALWILSMVDLLTLMNSVYLVLRFAAGVDDEKKPALITQIGLWVFAKLVCLVLFGFVLWNARSAPQSGLFLGLATLIVVPALGGMWWSHKELNHA